MGAQTIRPGNFNDLGAGQGDSAQLPWFQSQLLDWQWAHPGGEAEDHITRKT